MRKNFIFCNEGFVCKHCGHENPPLRAGCRNHCRKCLWSMHVDENVPGDRASGCGGMMMPISLDYSGKKGYIINHECVECGKCMRNKVAKDDDAEQLSVVSLQSNNYES